MKKLENDLITKVALFLHIAKVVIALTFRFVF